MLRVKFAKGEQRKFIQIVLGKINCPSLRALNQFGFEIPYSTLKSYYVENRLLPLDFFENLCKLAELKKEDFNFEILNENWGQIKGGKCNLSK